MARIGRIRAASGNASRYGATQSRQSSRDDEVFESSFRSIDTLKSQDSEDDFSFTDFCKSALAHFFNFTVAACINCKCPPCQRKDTIESEISSSLEDMDVKIMKERLRFHFMNPFQKWKYSHRRRFPWKLVIQLTSILLVTLQLVLFAHSKFALTDFLQQNKRTFTQLFVLSPAQADYTDPIPTPIRTIYNTADLFDQLNFTASQYFDLEQVAVGPYGYQWNTLDGAVAVDTKLPPHLHLKVRKYKQGIINPTTKTYHVSSKIVTDFYRITNTTDPINDAVDWEKILSELSKTLDIHLDFTVSSVYLLDQDKTAECFQFNISFEIDNDLGKGNMPMDMSVETKMTSCDNDSNSSVLDVDSGVLSDLGTTVVDGLVIFISAASIVLCVRSLLLSLRLCKNVRSFFVTKFEWKLKARHYVPLFNLWFVGIIVSNGMVLVGSIMKLVIAYTNPDSIVLVDITSIILGVAVFGQWCGLLRFLSYFDKYNILLITLRISMPSVIRFGVCAGILYVAFLLCGWLVLGPYHPKFRDPTVTSECLFSLVNGDDMFATYLEMSRASNAAWIFSKVYLYVFIALFIYVVLSVFISLISDTYETLHDHWQERARGLLKDFATDQLGRGRPRAGSHNSHHHSFVEGDEDYDLLRDIADASSEHQPLIVNGGPELYSSQPTLNIQRSGNNNNELHPPSSQGHTPVRVEVNNNKIST